ncbi:hypothetical protein GCM10008022_19550 [Paenibacillus hunanensis]|nr:hypothetical protein GCM10008022_19550 [Paenibacillus hunanensis]
MKLKSNVLATDTNCCCLKAKHQPMPYNVDPPTILILGKEPEIPVISELID